MGTGAGDSAQWRGRPRRRKARPQGREGWALFSAPAPMSAESAAHGRAGQGRKGPHKFGKLNIYSFDCILCSYTAVGWKFTAVLQTPQVKDSENRIRKTESNLGNRIFGFANPNVHEAEPRPPKQGDATRKPRDTRPTRHSRPADSATKRLRARGAGGRVGRRRRGGRGARGAPRRAPLKYWRGRAGFSFMRVVSFRLTAGYWRIGERQVYPMREAGSEAGALGRSPTATARPTTDRQQAGTAQKYLKGGEGERGGSIGAQPHRDRPLHRPDPTGQREHGTEGGGAAAEGDAGEPQPRSEATAGGRGEGAAGRGAEPPKGREAGESIILSSRVKARTCFCVVEISMPAYLGNAPAVVHSFKC